jgi:hypothetical protein
MRHKRQHYVPRSYLRAWCDPDCPPGQTSYVWRFQKNGGAPRNKSPEKLFHQTDMYTVRTEDGERDLTLETNLSRLEGEFTKLRRDKLDKRAPLTSEECLYLCMFVAAMTGRTPSHAEHTSRQWKRVLEMGERMQRAMEEATDEQRANMAALSPAPEPGEDNSFTMEEVERIVEHPIQEMLRSTVTELGPMLFEMPFVVLETSVAPGFITSDDPCVWYDRANYRTPLPRFAGGLASPTIEINLPLSPKQMLMFGHGRVRPGTYVRLDNQLFVNALNNRTRRFAHEYFVSSRKKARAAWF